ncbi:MAG TPA: hypothetical protein VNU72_05580 [Puia sp.]|nr:hypothetical protein [Puia sp.]
MSIFQWGKGNRGRDKKEVNLLIIGPTSCGKTAIIYFLYQFAALWLRGNLASPPANTTTATAPTPEAAPAQIPGRISEIELPDFVNQIKRELITTKDFIGTETGSIRYINYDTGKLILRIYNISGEIFSDTDQHRDILRDLGEHLDGIRAEDTYTLLCDECQPDATHRYHIDFNDVNIFFGSRFANASTIFTNAINNINTLRVVTKFDRVVTVPAINGRKISPADKNFEVMNQPLGRLNADEALYMAPHQVSYARPENETFDGWGELTYWKQFICTGMYDKLDPKEKLYIHDEATDRQALNPLYWKERNGITRLDMFGIKEIFEYILRGTKVKEGVAIFGPLASGGQEQHQISFADYKKILGV